MTDDKYPGWLRFLIVFALGVAFWAAIIALVWQVLVGW